MDVQALEKQVSSWRIDEESVFAQQVVGACGADFEWVIQGHEPESPISASGGVPPFVDSGACPLIVYAAQPVPGGAAESGYEAVQVDADSDMDLRSSGGDKYWYIRCLPFHPDLGPSELRRWRCERHDEFLLPLGLIQIAYRWSPTRADCVSVIRAVGKIVLPDGTVRDNSRAVGVAESLVRGLRVSLDVNPWFEAMDEDEYDYDGDFYT